MWKMWKVCIKCGRIFGGVRSLRRIWIRFIMGGYPHEKNRISTEDKKSVFIYAVDIVEN